MKKLLSIILVLAMIASLFANVGVVFASGYVAKVGDVYFTNLNDAFMYAMSINGEVDMLNDTDINENQTAPSITSDGTEESPYLISTLEDLKWFRDEVNNGNNYSGKFIKLTANIDLGGEEWEPIGYMGKNFVGNFDGDNHTISNLVITKTTENSAENNGIGLFGRTDSPAVIKNLTIENVDITGSLYVGAVVGHGYTGKAIENVTVKGNIAIDAWWYAGVIGGNGYMSLVNNCHVIGNNGSYIKGNDGSYIGGIWGFRGEGDNKITNCTVTNLDITGVDRVGGICGIGHYGNTVSGCAVDSVSIKATDPDATTVGLIVGACQGNTSSPSVFKENTVTETTAKVGDTVVESIYGTNINGSTAVTNYTVSIGNKVYETLADAAAVATSGDTITLMADAEIAEGTDVTIPDGVTLNGNGYSVLASGADHDTTTSFGYVVAGGKLTIEGITRIEKFSASYYDHVITIGEGASLDVFGKNRVSLGYGSSFYITGNIADAKTIDKATVKPSLNIAAGISIVGSNNTVFEAKNAYVVLGSSSSKNSNAGGVFDISFDNCIVEFTNQFTFATPKYDTLNPTFNVNIKDSVMTAATKLCLAATGSNVTVDNSTVTLGTYLHNSGTLTIKNGSTFTGSMIQYGENGGNSGNIIVDGSELIINCTSVTPMDGKTTGKVTLENNATANITSIKASEINVDATSKLTTEKLHSDVTITVDAANIPANTTVTVVEQTEANADTLEGKVTLTNGDGVEVDYDDGDVKLTKAAPTGNLSCAYTSNNTYWGECGGNAKESFEFKFYNDDTYMGYTSLNNIGGIIDGDVYVSWHIKLDAASNTDEYWTMAWDIAPTVAMQPNRVEQWVDGVKVAECAVEPNWSDRIFPVVAAVTDADGKILSYVNGTDGATLANAFANGGNIVLLKDITTNGTITIPADKVVTLDMNGKTITANDDRVTGNYELFYNYGSLTVIGNGTINLTATTDRDWNASSSIFHNRGGVLVIENGTFTHNGGTDMAYVVDNSGNSYGDATTTVKDGTLKSTYIAIRNRMDTYGANGGGNGVATVNIEGGNLSGKYAIWGQVSSAGVKGAINITGGTFTAAEGKAAVLVDEDATGDINTAISGGTFSSDVSDYCVDGFTCEQNADGTYGVVEVEYDTWDTKGGFIKGLPDEQNLITMLLVVGIQGRSYAEAGFEVTVGDTVVPMPTNVVYTKINIKDANGNSIVDPLVGATFGENNDYILCAKVRFSTELDGADISFRAYLVDYEGNKMYAKNTNGSLDYVGTIGRVVKN